MFSPKQKRRPAPWTVAFPEQRRQRNGAPGRAADPRQLDLRRYRKEAPLFLAELRRRGHKCPVLAVFDRLPAAMQQVLTVPWTGNRRSDKITECHHRFGRSGPLLLWQAGWAGVSRFGHRAIHQFPKVARALGWLAPAGKWNDQRLADKPGFKPRPVRYGATT